MSDSFKKFILPLGLILAIYAIIILLVLVPALSSIKTSKSLLSKKSAELQTVENKVKILEQTKADKVKTTGILGTVSALWPDSKDVSSFIIALENLAKSEGLTFNNVSITEASAKAVADTAQGKGTPNKNSVQFSFDTNGSYSQIYGTIKQLESFSRYNKVNSITLSTSTTGSVNAKITGLIFYGK